MAGRGPDAVIRQFDVSRESAEKLHAYVALLEKWQSRINLIGPSTVEQVWHRHIADALQLRALLPAGCRSCVDLGSGAGIPGLVLAIAFGDEAGFTVELIESNAKKAAFLREAVRITRAPCHIHNCRIEDLTLDEPPDVVLARAVAPLQKLLNLAAPLLESGARALFHKGQDVDIELTEATKYWNITARKHPSVIDSRSCILDITEVRRVART